MHNLRGRAQGARPHTQTVHDQRLPVKNDVVRHNSSWDLANLPTKVSVEGCSVTTRMWHAERKTGVKAGRNRCVQ